MSLKGKLYEFDGKSLTISQWAELYNLPHSTLENRVNVYGWDFVDALQTPVGRSRPRWKIEQSKRKLNNDRKKSEQQ